MSGMFRYAKGIAASLALATVAFAGRYVEHWLFPDVEVLQPETGIVVMDEFARASHSLSPMRAQSDRNSVTWKVAVVTNRSDMSSANVQTINHGQAYRTLSEQVVDVIYATPNTTFGYSNVHVPIVRPRGSCPLAVEAKDRVLVGTLQSQPESEFYIKLQQTLKSSKTQDVFVFVHGFNVSLDEAVARAAQMAEDIPFHGAVVAFSWQSSGQTDAYLSDEQLAERHFWSLAELLVGLKRNLQNVTRIHLLAHSMGNRVALRALNALAGTIGPTGMDVDPFLTAGLNSRRSQHSGSGSTTTPSRFDVLDGAHEIAARFPDWGSWRATSVDHPPLANLILAAPDVDAAEFARFVRNIRHLSRSVVLYTSDSDLALDASRKVHGGSFRAGDSRARLNIDGLRIVRVTGVSAKDPLGHSYYGSNARVLNQLNSLMRPPLQLSRTVAGWQN